MSPCPRCARPLANLAGTVTLTAGQHTLPVVAETDYFNLDYLDVTQP